MASYLPCWFLHMTIESLQGTVLLTTPICMIPVATLPSCIVIWQENHTYILITKHRNKKLKIYKGCFRKMFSRAVLFALECQTCLIVVLIFCFCLFSIQFVICVLSMTKSCLVMINKNNTKQVVKCLASACLMVHAKQVRIWVLLWGQR